MTRRTFIKRLFGSVLGLIGLSGGTYYYAKHIEPSLLTMKEETIELSNIPDAFDQVKILQFSDTHIGFHYDIPQFDALINELNSKQPDLILFTGDLFDAPNQVPFEILEQAAAVLSRLDAPLGKYWIYGNHDHGGYGTEIIATYMQKGGFQLLKNEHVTLKKEQSTITLAGLDDAMLGKPNVNKALQGANPDLFTLLMCHEPDYIHQVNNAPVDIQLSGHSHGGQVQIPFFGYLVTPPLAKQYVEGWYSIGTHPIRLYVSRGIGTTRLPYRFMCKPEYTIHTLQSTTNN
ncbi:metallophosphoesterase [Pontibacillus yanchengensis]|uniref:Metallophosphoesterase n=3 Tax=Pontibacillus yanchengensis TaxID=462910 RepID=A0ACC7VE49_9BACI|nr:metallophosphoesterase [Pontibacillus yanchengensis]MYL52209.1 metallophosphoesterase [Pontibacillus yanchengensis]